MLGYMKDIIIKLIKYRILYLSIIKISLFRSGLPTRHSLYQLFSADYCWSYLSTSTYHKYTAVLYSSARNLHYNIKTHNTVSDRENSYE